MARRDRAVGCGFVVKKPDGVLAVTTGIWATRSNAREAYTQRFKPSITWKQLYAKGARVAFVDVREL